MAKTGSTRDQPTPFGMVSTALQIGHSIIAVATLAIAGLVAIQLSPLRLNFGPAVSGIAWTIAAVPIVHFLLLVATAVWSGLAARGQTKVSKLWAWLGYFIPVTSYWLPILTLRGLVSTTTDAEIRLRRLILAWGLARGLSAPSALLLVFVACYQFGLPPGWAPPVIVSYIGVTVLAANLVSLFLIGRMRDYLATSAVTARHAEVFA